MRSLRIGVCLIITTLALQEAATDPMRGKHGASWKESLAAADSSALSAGSPILVCSDFPESDFVDLSRYPAEFDGILAPLSYYKVQSPVVALSRKLNKESQQQIARVLANPAQNRRFIFVGYYPSMEVYRYLAIITNGKYKKRLITDAEGVSVVEFSAK